jgi:hypothetical protein
MSTRCPLPLCPEPNCPEPDCPEPNCPEPNCRQPICSDPVCPDPVCPEAVCPKLSDYVIKMIPKKILFISALPNNNFVDLSWNAPYNGGIDISNYLIEYKKSTDLSNWSELISKTTSIKVSDLTNNIEYNFRVRAVNGIGYSPVSEIINATPTSFNIMLYVKIIGAIILLIILILFIMRMVNK